VAYQTQRSLRVLHLKTRFINTRQNDLFFFLIPWYATQRIQMNQFVMQSTQSRIPLLFTYSIISSLSSYGQTEHRPPFYFRPLKVMAFTQIVV
jgi:hypothetical protein